MSKRMENYLDFAESLGDDLNPETVEEEPKKYLMTWIPAHETTVQSLKTFDSTEQAKKFIESIYDPWMVPKTLMDLDLGKVIDWALQVDDISIPGKNIFNWAFEQ